MVTFTLGRTAPERSVTVPDRVAVATWACTAGAINRMSVKIPTPNLLLFQFSFIRIFSWVLRTVWGRSTLRPVKDTLQLSTGLSGPMALLNVLVRDLVLRLCAHSRPKKCRMQLQSREFYLGTCLELSVSWADYRRLSTGHVENADVASSAGSLLMLR